METHGSKRKLYKYRELNDYTDKIIENAELWFSEPSKLNDPFDCWNFLRFDFSQAQLAKYTQNWGLSNVSLSAVQLLSLRDEVSENAKQRTRQSSLLSMSLNEYNVLMFSHYCDSHTGCVLEFRNLETAWGESAQSVDYCKKMPNAQFFDIYQDHIEMEKFIYLKKSLEWEYEKEVRFFRYKKPSGNRSFPRECLSAIYFGCNAESVKIKKIKALCEKHYKSPVRLFKNKPSGDSWGMMPVEIPV
jgi:hypothetical protein